MNVINTQYIPVTLLPIVAGTGVVVQVSVGNGTDARWARSLAWVSMSVIMWKEE